MENHICIFNFEHPCWDLLTVFLAIFAALISVSYLLKPTLIFTVYQRTKNGKTKWVAEVRNKNILPFKIKEVKCEIAVSENIDFTVAKSLKMLKNETLFLNISTKKNQANYIFVPKEEAKELSKYKFIRVRLLATNIIGVKKHYERIYAIECLQNEDCKKLLSNHSHKRLTKKLIHEKKNKMNTHA